MFRRGSHVASIYGAPLSLMLKLAASTSGKCTEWQLCSPTTEKQKVPTFFIRVKEGSKTNLDKQPLKELVSDVGCLMNRHHCSNSSTQHASTHCRPKALNQQTPRPPSRDSKGYLLQRTMGPYFEGGFNLYYNGFIYGFRN